MPAPLNVLFTAPHSAGAGSCVDVLADAPTAPTAPPEPTYIYRPSKAQQFPLKPSIDPTEGCVGAGLRAAGLTVLLSQMEATGAFPAAREATLLAPVDEAFATLTQSALASGKFMRALLYNHMLEGFHNASTLSTRGSINSMMLSTLAAEACPGRYSKSIALTAAPDWRSLQLQAAASTADSVLAELSLCDGAVSVLVLRQLLLPCCASAQELLLGTSFSNPLLGGGGRSSGADVAAALRDGLLAAAAGTTVSQAQLSRAEPGWAGPGRGEPGVAGPGAPPERRLSPSLCCARRRRPPSCCWCPAPRPGPPSTPRRWAPTSQSSGAACPSCSPCTPAPA